MSIFKLDFAFILFIGFFSPASIKDIEPITTDDVQFGPSFHIKLTSSKNVDI